jgi:quinol monooxygenase YgiN
LLATTACFAPAVAQTAPPQHGLKTGQIAALYTAEVLPGQMDKFKSLANRIITRVAQEPGTLMYEWSFRPDGKTFDVVELYQNSDALVEHIKHFSESGDEPGQVQK